MTGSFDPLAVSQSESSVGAAVLDYGFASNPDAPQDHGGAWHHNLVLGLVVRRSGNQIAEVCEWPVLAGLSPVARSASFPHSCRCRGVAINPPLPANHIAPRVAMAGVLWRMKAKRVFRPQEVLAAAQAGKLTRAALRQAIATAEEFGNQEVAQQLRAYLASTRATRKRR